MRKLNPDYRICLPVLLSLLFSCGSETCNAIEPNNRAERSISGKADAAINPLSRIVEAFSSMKEDLDKERKVILKHWAKRKEQIERVMQSTVGMYGDLQGIAGSTIREIEGLEFRL